MTQRKKLHSQNSGYTICFDCGPRYGEYHDGVSSVWVDVCDYCKETKAITEARDFKYPELPDHG